VIRISVARNSANQHVGEARSLRLEGHAGQQLCIVVKVLDVELLDFRVVDRRDRERHRLQALRAPGCGYNDLI
jgi:hypothetical protein